MPSGMNAKNAKNPYQDRKVVLLHEQNLTLDGGQATTFFQWITRRAGKRFLVLRRAMLARWVDFEVTG